MLKPSGAVVGNIAYIVMELIRGQILFDLVATINEHEGLGEAAGRFFMTQFLETIEYMHNQGIVHRDLKAENIMIDDQMNIKILDFGFASYQNNDELTSYLGTPAYMAPEIRKGLEYKGSEVDIFALGVVMFIVVRGLFPFTEARENNYWWKLLKSGQIETYFSKIDKDNKLSPQFRDLIISMIAEEGSNRPTIAEIK